MSNALPKNYMKRAGMAAILAATIGLGGLATTASAAPASPVTALPMHHAPIAGQDAQEKEFAERIFQLMNQERERMGLKKLKRLHDLDVVAHNWSERMAREGRMYHNPSYARQYPAGWTRAAENVAFGYRTPTSMYQGWYNSPGHYENMFNPNYTHVGVGVAITSDGVPYGTQNFATYNTPPKETTPPAIPGDNGSSTRNIDDGGIGGTGNQYFLNDTFSANANTVFRYGNAGGRVYVGDWDGDGKDTLAYRIGSTFYIRNSNSAGSPHTVIHYGRPGDRVYVGDWNGDGKDTFAVRRGKTYHVKNSLSGGNADQVIHYGREGDDILVGDWNGNGKDTFAVRRGSVYHVKNSMSGGNADQVVNYGRSGDDVYVGDWNGNGKDSFAVRRGKTYYIANAIRGGDADRVLAYGRTTDTTLVGDWNGDGRDTLGVRR